MRILTAILLCICLATHSRAQQKKSTLYFEFGTTALTPSSSNESQQLIKKLSTEKPLSIVVNGYTDKVGSDAFNEKLALQRADAIKQLLQSVLPGASISLQGFGSANPVSDKDDEQHLNRRVEILMTLPVKEDKAIEVESYGQDVQEQRFKIDLNDSVSITAIGGTTVTFTKGTIQNKRGDLMKGKAELIIKEYYKPSDIILAGLHSNSNQGLLQTAGMFYLTIIQGKDTMDSKTRKKVEITMPVSSEDLDNMKVFVSQDAQDSTSNWVYTGTDFSRVSGYWEWPDNQVTGSFHYIPSLTKRLIDATLKLQRRLFGKARMVSKYSDNTTWIENDAYRPKIKRGKITYKFIDSTKLRVNALVYYTDLGKKQFNKAFLDTSFYVKYHPGEYLGITDNLKWINCDRFYQYENKTNFYVTTPGVKGMDVVLYYKTIKSYMPAIRNGDGHRVFYAPLDMPVVILAIGRKGNDFYFGKQEIQITNKIAPAIPVQKVSEEEFRKSMASIK